MVQKDNGGITRGTKLVTAGIVPIHAFPKDLAIPAVSIFKFVSGEVCYQAQCSY